jgi:hypothetical protein
LILRGTYAEVSAWCKEKKATDTCDVHTWRRFVKYHPNLLVEGLGLTVRRNPNNKAGDDRAIEVLFKGGEFDDRILGHVAEEHAALLAGLLDMRAVVVGHATLGIKLANHPEKGEQWRMIVSATVENDKEVIANIQHMFA